MRFPRVRMDGSDGPTFCWWCGGPFCAGNAERAAAREEGRPARPAFALVVPREDGLPRRVHKGRCLGEALEGGCARGDRGG